MLAFGLFARALPDTDEFKTLRTKVAGIELADSITSDCHKMLNVVSTRSRVLVANEYN
jgi:glutamate/tyrosine decarboxylase-like PLP-dependent enzyme